MDTRYPDAATPAPAGSTVTGTRETGPEPAFDHRALEAGARALWEEHQVFRFDRAGSGPVFSVDTPPPYVSASHLHVGHAMSYSQADFLVRYRRMRGERVFYPMGFDDNGLPTERFVEQKYGVTAAEMPRAEFVALCLTETRQTALRYEDLWRRLGLSVDWSLRYSTIDERCRRTAQAAFITLYEAGHIRRAEDPILWCPQCRTALAQADVDDLQRRGRMYRIAFRPADGDGGAGDGTAGGQGVGAAGGPGVGTPGGPPVGPLVIATTRPELLPACVALYAHPQDPRYQGIIGGRATVPIFGQQVPVRADDGVDPDLGTGLIMVCTFGDGEDVARWRRDGLELRLVVTGDGRLGPPAGEYAGMPLDRARKAILAGLAEVGALVGDHAVSQTVGVHERCQTPVEFQMRPQWFVGLTAHRARLRERARELEWVPESMRRRLEDWIDGLKWDWNLSRQRHYGVPFPVWFCRDCGEPALAERSALPVDPLAERPPVPACRTCGGGEFDADPDVMDTWLTSSLTPQINDGWASGSGPDPRLVPMSLRVQAFEIIRTWLFYTLAQSHLLFDRLPWRTVMISGWGLNEQGHKIAKRDLARAGEDAYNRYLPEQVIERYGADALRLWATKARIGSDLRYHEKDVRAGRKLVVKLWNVARFVTRTQGAGTLDAGPGGTAGPAERTAVDRWLRWHLARTVAEATEAFERYDPMRAYQAASWFFWNIYCDRYIEMVKSRFRYPDEHTDAERDSARATLRESLRVVLGLFAPFAPFTTEHLYQSLYRSSEGVASLHLTRWPAVARQPYAGAEPGVGTGGAVEGGAVEGGATVAAGAVMAGATAAEAGPPEDVAVIEDMVTILDQVRALRTRLRLGAETRAAVLVLQASDERARSLVAVIAEPLRAAARAERVVTGEAAHDSGVPGVRVDLVGPAPQQGAPAKA